MKIFVITLGCALLFCVDSAAAAESLSGKYLGHIVRPNRHAGFTLVIESVDGDIVKGTAIRTEKNCFGEYPVQGQLQGEKLTVTSTGKGGRGGDCEVNLELRLQGNKLVGTTRGGNEVVLSK